MDKHQVISLIKSKLQEGVITQNDLKEILTGRKVSAGESHRFIKILYGVGAILAVLGIVILAVQNWGDIGFFGQLIITAGISIVTFMAGFLMGGDERRVLSQIWFAISAATAPIGFIVFFNQVGIDMNATVLALTFAFLTILYTLALFITKRNILMLIALIFEGVLYGIIVGNFFGLDQYIRESIIVYGLASLFVAHFYQKMFAIQSEGDEKEKKSVSEIIYTTGTLMVLAAAISYDGYVDAILFALIFAGFYLSSVVRSKGILIVSTLFLMGHILKITSVYFASSIGWPIALIIAGFLIIAIGYGSITFSKKYVK